MLDKIKGVMGLEKRMDELTSKSKDNAKSLNEQSKSIQDIKKTLADMKKELVKFNESAQNHNMLLDKQADDFLKLKKAVEDEIYELKLLKQQFQTKLIDEILASFREELQKETKKLDTDVRGYNELKEKLVKITDDVNAVSLEIKRFSDISSKIKAADFEMANYARELTKNDREKLRLMNELDRLQKLISSERRRHNR